MAVRRVFEEHLKRVDWDEWQFPIRLYTFFSYDPERRPIAISPKIAFGRPIVLRAGDLTYDYGLTVEEVEQAVLYERTA